jgi:ketosteroid isomerase-like protein
MTTKETIQQYFDRLARKSGWDESFAQDMGFTSHISPVKQVKGRDAYLESTKRFYSTIGSVQVRNLLVEGDRAVALTHYEIRPPNLPSFTTDVAEVFSVRAGKIQALDIYFDTAPFPK